MTALEYLKFHNVCVEYLDEVKTFESPTFDKDGRSQLQRILDAMNEYYEDGYAKGELRVHLDGV